LERLGKGIRKRGIRSKNEWQRNRDKEKEMCKNGREVRSTMKEESVFFVDYLRTPAVAILYNAVWLDDRRVISWEGYGRKAS
jgi:hypothetical protein